MIKIYFKNYSTNQNLPKLYVGNSLQKAKHQILLSVKKMKLINNKLK